MSTTSGFNTGSRFQLADSLVPWWFMWSTRNCLPMWHLWPVFSILLRLCAGTGRHGPKHGLLSQDVADLAEAIVYKRFLGSNDSAFGKAQSVSIPVWGSTPTRTGIVFFALTGLSARPGKQLVVCPQTN